MLAMLLSAVLAAFKYVRIMRYIHQTNRPTCTIIVDFQLQLCPPEVPSCVGCAPRRACERRAAAASRQVALAAAKSARLWFLDWTLVS